MVARWFRVYEDLIDDPKIIVLPESLRWCWVATLCLASKNGGKLPALAHVAVSLRLSQRRASGLLTRLHEAGLLDKLGDSYVPHNWDKRQYKNDSADPTAPRRVQRYRNRLRDDANPQAKSTPDDDSVTPALRNAGVSLTRPETESETEPDSDSKTDSPQRPPRGRLEAGRGSDFEMQGKAGHREARVSTMTPALGPETEGANEQPCSLDEDEQDNASDTGATRGACSARSEIDGLADAIAGIFARAGRTPPDLSRAAFWLAEGFDRRIVLATIEQLFAAKPNIASLNYFDAAILRAHAARQQQRAAAGSPLPPEFPIEKAVAFYAKTRIWSRHAGPGPGHPGCRAPPELFARHGLSPSGVLLPKHDEEREP